MKIYKLLDLQAHKCFWNAHQMQYNLTIVHMVRTSFWFWIIQDFALNALTFRINSLTLVQSYDASEASLKNIGK